MKPRDPLGAATCSVTSGYGNDIVAVSILVQSRTAKGARVAVNVLVMLPYKMGGTRWSVGGRFSYLLRHLLDLHKFQ